MCWGHLNKDLFPPFQGIGIFPFLRTFHWKGKLLRCIEGDEKSLAAQMVEFIEQSDKIYPYSQTYSLIGPNSNTYVQWILNHFPQSNMRLPWNALGKNKMPKN